MKKLIILLFALMIGCNLQGDNDPKFLRLIWDPNPESDMSHYEVFWWQGDDTLSWSLSVMTFQDTINHSFTADSIVSNLYVITYDYTRGGAKAVDSQGLKSKMGLSRFYSYAEFFAPSAPANLRTIK